MAKMKLTKKVIDALPVPEKDRVTYWDTELKGFCLRVSTTAKTFYAKKRLKGKPQWVKIGEYGVYTPDQARKEALEVLADLNKGIDVNREKKRARTKGLTVAKVLEKYIESRPNLRGATKESYESLLSHHLSSWLDKPIAEITGDMVSRKHLQIVEKAKRDKIKKLQDKAEKARKKDKDNEQDQVQEQERIELTEEYGQAQANKVMRVFRLLFNYYTFISDTTLENPVKRLNNTRQWFNVERRKTSIKEHELRAWYDAVQAFSNPIAGDALLLLLLSGCREKEILTLKWDDVDMKGETFTIRAEVAKNHKEHVLPMSDSIKGIFKRRESLQENIYVFPGQGGKGPIKEMRRAVEAVIKASGVNFCIHDLRRTFTSFAEQEVSYAVLKRLLNHYTGSDVTAGYLVIPLEQLREPMQRITSRIMAGMLKPEGPEQAPVCEENGKVLQFKTKR